MNNASELLHLAAVFGFALIGALGIPGALLVLLQMAMDGEDGHLRPRR
jgi:hypothetical protein